MERRLLSDVMLKKICTLQEKQWLSLFSDWQSFCSTILLWMASRQNEAGFYTPKLL